MFKNFEFKKTTPELKLDTLKSEHLKGEYKPIITSVGVRKEHLYENNFVNDNLLEKALDVDFYGDIDKLREKGILKNGDDTYVMSSVDVFNKKTSKLVDCTGIIAVGAHKSTGNNISFLTHQFPKSFLNETKRSFNIDLRTRLQRIKERSIEGSIDVIIAGGHYIFGSASSKREYKKSIAILSKIIEEELGFNPVIVTEPKDAEDDDSIEFDTKERRLYFIRGEKTSKNMNEAYLPKDLEEKSKKWDREGYSRYMK